MILIDLLGWLGMALLLTAFYLASSKRISYGCALGIDRAMDLTSHCSP